MNADCNLSSYFCSGFYEWIRLEEMLLAHVFQLSVSEWLELKWEPSDALKKTSRNKNIQIYTLEST